MLKTALIAGLGVLLTSVCAFADGSTQWEISSATSGTYSYAGGTAPLIGSNIAVTSVEGIGTTTNSGSIKAITDGKFSFTSGPETGPWMWGAGGSLSLTGCIAGVTATTCTGSNNVVLVSDEFTNVSITKIGTNRGVVFGNLEGTINAQVAAYYGISTVFTATSTGDDIINVTGTAGHSFSGVHSVAPGGTLNLVAAEGWGVSSALALFVVGLGLFGGAARLGLLKTRLA